MGSSREARIAGKRPKNNPIAAETMKGIRIEVGLTTNGKVAALVTK